MNFLPLKKVWLKVKLLYFLSFGQKKCELVIFFLKFILLINIL